MTHLRDIPSQILKQISAGLLWFLNHLLLILLLLALAVWARSLYRFGWSGFGSSIDSDGKIIPAKTLWDWLQLVLVPAFLAGGALWFNSIIQQVERERAEKRAKVDQEIADDRLKEQALQNYLDRMSELLLSGQFDNPETGEKARTVARARTLTTLHGLNGERKAVVLRFLHESKLITGEKGTIDLSSADLSEIPLNWAYLEEIDLNRANLVGARLLGTHLNKANLVGAHLEGAVLEGAYLSAAHLEGAHLEVANLTGAHLQWTNLTGAHLKSANLTGAHLRWTNLIGADITQEQLDSAHLDENTILPDGSLYKLSVSATPSAQSPQPPVTQAPPEDNITQKNSP